MFEARKITRRLGQLTGGQGAAGPTAAGGKAAGSAAGPGSKGDPAAAEQKLRVQLEELKGADLDLLAQQVGVGACVCLTCAGPGASRLG